jgi:hypothetical protein
MKFFFLLLILVFAFNGRAEELKESPKKSPKPSGARDEAFEPPAGEDASIVQVGNLIYAGNKSSVCFSDNFLQQAARDSKISTANHFNTVKTSSADLFKLPFVVMTGEGVFKLLPEERNNLRKFLEGGGFLLASAGCSSPDWDRSFRVEMGEMFKDKALKAIPMTHKIFKTVYEIPQILVKHGRPKPLEGIEINGRIAIIYSPDGLNDTGHVKGCCCCGGNEISNCEQINVNILAYALTH